MKKKVSITSDAPINYIEEDLFNISSYVDALYDLFTIIDPNHGFVIALNGEWGSGKSSVINLLKEKQLREGNTNFKIIDFLPWNIIDKETLLKNFFISFKNAIFEESNNQKIRRLIEKYYSAIIEGIKIIHKTNSFINFFESIVNLFFEKKEESIFELKNLITEYLYEKYKGKKIVIIIDDLDRLTDEEICIVLKLIKEIADFPNVIYLIAMDKERVIRAIRKFYKYDKLSSYKYLEKFIQFNYDLPNPNQENIETLFFNEINDLVEDEYFTPEKKYLTKVYENCLKEQIKTPRNMKLFINQYKIAYQKNIDYVNFVDYLAIFYLQLFIPELYSFIKNHKELFTNDLSNYNSNSIQLMEKQFKKEIDDNIKKFTCGEEYAKKVFNTLFPAWKNSCGDATHIEFNNDYMRNLVQNKYCFDLYFGKQTLTKKIILKNDLIKIVESNDPQKVCNFLKQYSDTDNSISNIEILYNCWIYLDEKKEQLQSILNGIFIYYNNSDNSYIWYEKIQNTFLTEVSRDFYKDIIINLIKYKDFKSINNAFLFFIDYATAAFDKRFLSDETSITLLNSYIESLIQNKIKLTNTEPITLIFLLLKYQQFKSLEDYIKINKDHSIFLIYEIFEETAYRMFFYPESLTVNENTTSTEFWTEAGNKQFLYMKDYDDIIVSYIKKKKFNDYSPSLSESLEEVLYQYANIVHLKL